MDGPSSFKRGVGGVGGPNANPRPERFEDLARQKDADIDVALGAALLARDVYPDLDVPRVLAELDQLAAPLFDRHLELLSADQQARTLGEYLQVAGFHGNEAEYYDPKNSLLSDVLARKTGIPLTLAIVYCEVARRVGVPARGVGFPGHFVVRIERAGRAGSPLIIDPFFGGRVLQADELKTRLARVLGPSAPDDLEPHLTPASARAILVRMLTNLKAIYLTRGEKARAHLAVDRIASLLPNAAGPLFERGRLAAQLGARESARSDLTRALTLHPDADDERAIRAELAQLPDVTVKRASLN